jgi:beta-glucanase (GH16 family)
LFQALLPPLNLLSSSNIRAIHRNSRISRNAWIALLGVTCAIGLIIITIHLRTGPTFDDEFTGPAGESPNYGMSKAYWNVQGCWMVGCGNESPTQYSAANAYLDGNGDLVLEADKGSNASCGFALCQYTSSGLSMFANGSPTWSQEYGTFSARIDVPVGKGLWPGFWLVGSTSNSSVWPMDGEIDIMEVFGQQSNVIEQHVEGGSPMLRWGKGWSLPEGQSDAGWHTYSVTWSPSGIQWSVDGTATLSLTAQQAGSAWMQSFEHPFHIILDLTVGGNAVGSPTASTIFPAQMLVDWVRVTSG